MMRAVIQTLMGVIGTIGFSILFNVKERKKLIAAAGGAAVSMAVYLWTYAVYDDKVVSMLCATVMVGLLSEILARLIKAPVIILLVPMLIPLFPGSDLFYATSHLVQENEAEAKFYLELVLKEAGAIAFGIILVTCFVQVLLKVIHHFKRGRALSACEQSCGEEQIKK